MRCDELRVQLVETGRGRSLPSDLRARVFAHAANCAECAQVLEAERALTLALAGVALHADAAPARVLELLRRELPAPVPVRHMVHPRWAILEAAAAVIAGFLVLRPLWQPLPARPKPAAVAATLRSATSPPTAAAVPVRMAARASVRRAQAPALEADDFMPLPYADSIGPDESADIVHVQMPRESLLALGVPVNGDRMNDQIFADIMIGADGTARAIRLSR